MERKTLIIETARKVIVRDGLFDASIAKIAKEAGIPVGSVYTYYSSKEELINDIFISVKQEMGHHIFQPIGTKVTEKKELKIYWERAVDFGMKHQEKFFFAEQFANSPLIKPANKEEVKQSFERVFNLLKSGIEKGILKNMDLFILHNIIYTNITGTIKFCSHAQIKMDIQLKNQLFECCWDSIKL